jgi:phosphate transport system substrate-binding protein
MEAWVRQYRLDPHLVLGRNVAGGLGDEITSDRLDYESVGSLVGIQRIRAGLVDFATSEMPLHADYLKSAALMQFSWVFGGVAVVVNLPGVAAMNLDAATLAAIYLGRVTRWSDPMIVAQNPAVSLSNAPIIAVHRSDGSGSTFTFSNFMSRYDKQWREEFGVDLSLKSPSGKGVKGGGEMVAALKSTPYSIGYVGLAQARSASLTLARLRNSAGRYLSPEPAHIAAAVTAARQQGDELQRLPIDSPGAQSYPLIATVFGLMSDPLRSQRQRRTAEFVRWTLARGSALAHELGYLRLPERIAKSTLARLTPAS